MKKLLTILFIITIITSCNRYGYYKNINKVKQYNGEDLQLKYDSIKQKLLIKVPPDTIWYEAELKM